MFIMNAFAVTRVSAVWVDENFTSLRVTLPEGGAYRISYLAVNKSNTTEAQMITTKSISHVVMDLNPDCFYTIMVEAVSLESREAVNGSIAMGEQVHIRLIHFPRHLTVHLLNCIQFSILCLLLAGIGFAIAAVVAVVITSVSLGLCCCRLARQVEKHLYLY